MTRVLSGHQPYLFAHAGYWRKMADADAWVTGIEFDFTRKTYVHRVRIAGERWLTVPVVDAQALRVKISDKRIAHDGRWWLSMLNKLGAAYGQELRDEVEQALGPFAGSKWLIEFVLPAHDWMKQRVVEALRASGQLPMRALATLGMVDRYDTPGLHRLPPTERLIEMCRMTSCDTYLAGAKAVEYLDVAKMNAAGIAVRLQQWKAPSTLSALDLMQRGEMSWLGPRSVPAWVEWNVSQSS